eukprot:9488651-Pyramimonas_sp.AAC.1
MIERCASVRRRLEEGWCARRARDGASRAFRDQIASRAHRTRDREAGPAWPPRASTSPDSGRGKGSP